MPSPKREHEVSGKGNLVLKNRKAISILMLCIILLSLVSSVFGIVSNQGNGQYTFQSLRGETVTYFKDRTYRPMKSCTIT